MFIVNGYFAVYPEKSFTLYNKTFLSKFVLPFAASVMVISSSVYHFTAILLLFVQFLKSDKIVECLQIISNMNIDNKFNCKRKIILNFIISLIFFLNTLVRGLVQLKKFSFEAFFSIIVFLQTPAILFSLINFFDDIKKFLVRGYEKVKENVKLRKNIKNNLKQLKMLDRVLVKIEEAFGAQLTILAVCYTLTFVFYVSFRKLLF
jgi:hypothetical protein